MKPRKYHFHCLLTITLACYCVWLIWACHTAYTAFDNAFVTMLTYLANLFK